MTDPVTIGVLAATALGTAADAALKGALGEAAKDAYRKLKDLVGNWAGADVAALEKTPASAPRRYVLAEVINDQPDDELARVKTFALALVAALKEEAAKNAAGGPVGLDVGDLTALEVQLDAINATEGTGAKFGRVQTETFRAGPINVGPSAGKTEK
jgi:hypothetical protein